MSSPLSQLPLQNREPVLLQRVQELRHGDIDLIAALSLRIALGSESAEWDLGRLIGECLTGGEGADVRAHGDQQ